jgi:hypothetical protein
MKKAVREGGLFHFLLAEDFKNKRKRDRVSDN